jgi:heme ABC exporter ATP-binding subunit CcmA
LRDVSFELPWGTTLALLGHNGAGKSTLLRTLATLVRPERGTLRIAGFDRATHPARIRAAVGFVGHQPLLYDELTSTENLRFYAKLYRLPDAASRVREALAMVGAEGYGGQRVRTLSNGMQKRVAIARALLHRPAVLLLDEPETGLDAAGLIMLDAAVHAVRDGGASVVMSTHSAERGLALGDRLLVLARGRVVLSSPTDEATQDGIQALLTGAA